MHVHVYYDAFPMRTTIDLTDGQRAELLRLAARRGLKGFSQIVQEAVDTYIREQRGKVEAVRTALALRGSFRGRAAAEFEKRVQEIRKSWR
jgi:Arc/MetJ family transcription regulator